MRTEHVPKGNTIPNLSLPIDVHMADKAVWVWPFAQAKQTATRLYEAITCICWYYQSYANLYYN